jgi:hypothetical protein
MIRCCSILLLLTATACAQDLKVEDPIQALVNLFDRYRIVMLGELPDSRQQWELLERLITVPAFQEKVNDIVMGYGNSRYQDVVDRFVEGQNVPLEEVQKAWRNAAGALGAVSPVYGNFYSAVRAVNRKLPKERRLRILLGDPPVDWDRVQSRDDLSPFIPFRDVHYASVVRYEVLAKGRRALLTTGTGHFRRSGGRPGSIEGSLLMAGAKAYVVIPGSNMVGGFDDLDPRFEQYPAPWFAELKDNWLSNLPLTGSRGSQGTWAEMADAYLYLGPRDKLTRLRPRRVELEGTAYGKEVERRLVLIFGKVPDFVPRSDEVPLYERNPTPPPPLPPPPIPR